MPTGSGLVLKKDCVLDDHWVVEMELDLDTLWVRKMVAVMAAGVVGNWAAYLVALMVH